MCLCITRTSSLRSTIDVARELNNLPKQESRAFDGHATRCLFRLLIPYRVRTILRRNMFPEVSPERSCVDSCVIVSAKPISLIATLEIVPPVVSIAFQ